MDTMGDLDEMDCMDVETERLTACVHPVHKVYSVHKRWFPR